MKYCIFKVHLGTECFKNLRRYNCNFILFLVFLNSELSIIELYNLYKIVGNDGLGRNIK